MPRIILKLIFLFLVTTTINAQVFKEGDKLQIIATNIKATDNIVTAWDDVLLHSPQYYITAKKIIYNKTDSTVELFDDVNIIRNGSMITFSNYAFLDFKDELDTFKPILLMDHTNNIWVNSEESKKTKDLIEFKKSSLSSCDCYDPAWSIGFSSGDYDVKKQWLNVYNAALYINQVPVLYTPYFGFPTNRTRRTGLLRPTLGYSNTEGVLYAQPYFYAPSLNWDIEYVPQIRTQRGNGHQLKYRFKDSMVSSLEFETALFVENNKYFQNSNLINKKHYGWDLEYQRENLISTQNNQDGLVVSLHSLNDVDYINTKIQNNSTIDKKLVESQIKYFYNTPKYYADIDFKHYKDTSKTTKEEHNTTMQELPKINLHKYSNKLLVDNLLYSADIKYSNKTRTTGLKAKTTDIFIPLSYSYNLLDDYLTFMYEQQLSFTNIEYGNNHNLYDNGQFFESKHIFSLSTDLIKPYKDYIHSINLKTALTIPNTIKQEGDLYSISTYDSNLDAFPVVKTNKNITFSLNQSIYDKNTFNKILTHKLKQSVFHTNGEYELSDLENEFILYYKYGQLSNRLFFNHQESMVINSSTSASFKRDNFTSLIYYSYSKDTSSNTQSYTYRDLLDSESMTLKLGYKFNKFYKISYKEEYDLLNEISKLKEYTFNIDKKCWGLNLILSDSLVASATIDNKAIRQNIFYIEFILKPIITINQKYLQQRREE